MKSLLKVHVVLLFSILFFSDAFSQIEDKLDLSEPSPASGSTDYINYAIAGSYENDFYVGEVPEWHYYDLFGNKLLDGFHLYGMTKLKTSVGIGSSAISLHPFLKKWLNGLLQVGDIADQFGILALIGEGIKNRFTPYSMNQRYFTGARIDLFFDIVSTRSSLSFIGSRISSTGNFPAVKEYPEIRTEGDWLLGIRHLTKYKDIFEIGGTYLNYHHENNEMWDGNPFNGWDTDTNSHTLTALHVTGFDARCNLTEPKLTLYGEYKRSQEIMDADSTGESKPQAGNVAVFNGHWDFLEKWRLGGEGYVVESRFQTTFHCPVDTNPDPFGSKDYLYSLIDDNDDNDKYPENGANKLLGIPRGDPDGVIPEKYDKDKNGMNDWEEDFLNHDSDPPKSKLYYDRNNNGIPDEIEDDPYPDYPYIPSYYLEGEKYWRYDDLDKMDKEYTSDGQASKGLLGVHLYGRYEIIPKLHVTLGMILDKSQEKSYQNVYEDTTVIGQTYSPEMASTIYSLIQFKKDFEVDKNLTIQNYLRFVRDNIPNHTQTFSLDEEFGVAYHTVVDELDYRDALINMLIAQYTMFKNRGFNFTTRGKYEFTKHLPHLEFNYPDLNISSLFLVNKCHYIYLIPLLKDMFLIPKYKNVYQMDTYGPRKERLDYKFRNHNMINIASLVYDWKFTAKTKITLGLQGKTFNDLLNSDENYLSGNFSIQLLMQDRYVGLNVILTAGFSRYRYNYYKASDIMHNPFNNPHRIIDNISAFDLFIKVHGGF